MWEKPSAVRLNGQHADPIQSLKKSEYDKFSATCTYVERQNNMRHSRISLFVLIRVAVVLAVLMVGLFFAAAAITRANFFSNSSNQTSPAVHANAY